MIKNTKDELTLIKKTTLRLKAEDINDIAKMLKKYKRVRVLDFGTFELRKIPSKTMYNSIVGKKITIKGRNRIVFTAFDSFAKQFNPTPKK